MEKLDEEGIPPTACTQRDTISFCIHCLFANTLSKPILHQEFLVDKEKGILKIVDLGLGRAFIVPMKSYTHEKMLKFDPADRISAKAALDHPYFDNLDKSQF